MAWNCEGKALVSTEMQRCWKIQSHQTSVKEGCTQGVELAQEKEYDATAKLEDQRQTPDTSHGTTEFGVCPSGFQSCFGPIFLHYVPIPFIWSRKVYSMPL